MATLKGRERGMEKGITFNSAFHVGIFVVVSFLCSKNEDSQLLCHIEERQRELFKAPWFLLVLMTLFSRYLLSVCCVPDTGLVLEVDPLLFHWAGL